MATGVNEACVTSGANAFELVPVERHAVAMPLGRGGVAVGQHHRVGDVAVEAKTCLLYTSPSPRDGLLSRMPSSA